MHIRNILSSFGIHITLARAFNLKLGNPNVDKDVNFRYIIVKIKPKNYSLSHSHMFSYNTPIYVLDFSMAMVPKSKLF